MADISVMNVGGTDYNIKDSTSRTNSTKAMSLPAYYETGNTASQAYSIVGTPINWKGTLYYTKTTVAKGATWVVGTNLTAATNLGKLVRNIKTYVGSDSKLHFVDLTGADTALNFSGAQSLVETAGFSNMSFGGDHGGWGARWTTAVSCEVGDLIVASFARSQRDAENTPSVTDSSGVTILNDTPIVWGHNIVAKATSTSFSFKVSLAQGSGYDAYPRCVYWIFR